MTAPHCGTPYGYTVHVRDQTPKCLPCRRAHADTRADYRRRRYLHHAPLSVDATGTRRRLYALAAIGHSLADQSQRLGQERSWASSVARRGWVWAETADKVCALYDELSMTPGTNVRASNDAKRFGWPPPLAWDDDEIDDPAASPVFAPDRPVGPGPARDMEREDRVMELTRAGVSVARIADRLHVTERYVGRVRARNRDERQEKSA